MAAVAVVRAGLGGQFTLERARAAMIACVLRALHFHTPQSMMSMRGAPVVRDRCHACRTWVVSRWGVSDAHGEAARALIDTYVECMTNDGADRPPPFDRPRESVHSDVVRVVAARFAHLAHTEGILVCWACAIPVVLQIHARMRMSRPARAAEPLPGVEEGHLPRPHARPVRACTRAAPRPDSPRM